MAHDYPRRARRACRHEPARAAPAGRRCWPRVAGVALTARLGCLAARPRGAEGGAAGGARRARPACRRSTPPRCAADDAGRRRSTTARVALHGRWVAGAHRLPRQPADGRPPRLLSCVTPLRLDDAPSAVLVQRGWVAARLRRPHAGCRRSPTPAGEVEVHGRIAPPPARLYEFAGGDAGRDPAESRPRRVRPRDRPARCGRCRCCRPTRRRRRRRPAARLAARPAVDVHKHYGYAFQWFALCGADRRSVCLVPTRPPPAPPRRLTRRAAELHGALAAARRRSTTRRAPHRARPAEDAAGAAGLRRAGDRVVLHLLRDPARGPHATTAS